MSYKGKAVMTEEKGSSGKRKRPNRDVLQFFEDAADEEGDDGSDWSDFFDDQDFLGNFMEEDKVRSAPEKRDQVPIFPKEEELSGDELEKMLEERYRTGSGFVRYADDDYDSKRSVDKDFFMPSAAEPTIWKVKCKVGREKNVVFCLIQKFVDLKNLGTKLQIISTFAAEHIKGFVFVEAEKQSDVTEACYQLADVYCTLVAKVPSNEVGQVLNVRRKTNDVKEGTWARVKNGIYRGDLTQVVAVNNDRKRATVKLIPRIDMQALMDKYGSGSRLKKPKKNGVPTARLISSRDLEEFRPLIQYRRDRDTGKSFEFLDGLMLKDGFLFKKMSIDSLAFWDVNPTEDELQKFTLPIQDESDNVEWLSQLYGEKKKKVEVKMVGKGGGKGEGSSGSNEPSSFEVHDLVLFGKRDFGMVIGMDKDDKYRVLKDDSDGPITLTFGQKELKYVPMDKKFTAPDHRLRTISINDGVKILDGPSKDKQGIVKQIYRGIVFVYDENDLENAYFCSKSKMSEKVKLPGSCHGKDEGGFSTFEDVPSSPKSPLSKPWEMRENASDDRSDKGSLFSVGQSLRIRVGPLKGYLCRVLAVRFSDVTVKLDSQQKVLTVKPEHLAEVRGKNSSTSMSDAPGLDSSFKPFDLLGADNAGNDWLGASGSADAEGWKVGTSNERSTWSAVSSWGAAVQDGTAATTLPASVNNDSEKEDGGWLTKVNSNQNSNTDAAWRKQSGAGASSSWGKAKDSGGDPADASNSWGKAKDPVSDAAGASNSWGKAKETAGDPSGASNSWGKAKETAGDPAGASNSWGKKDSGGDLAGASNSWGKAKDSGADASNSWGKAKDSGGDPAGASNSWGKVKEPSSATTGTEAKPSADAWGKAKEPSADASNSWGKAKEPSWGNNSFEKGKDRVAEGGSSWGKSAMGGDDKQTGPPEDSWRKVAENESNKSFGGSGGWNSSQSSGGNAWGKGGTSDTSGDKKGGDGWQAKSWNKESGSTGGGGNSESEGFGAGRGFGGRGRGGFGGGRDNGGRGRSDGRGGSWGNNSSGGNDGGNRINAAGGGSSWGNQNSAEGGLSWGNAKPSGSSGGGGGWGNAKPSGNSGGGGGWGN